MSSLLANAALCMAKAPLPTRAAILTRMAIFAPAVPAALQACEAILPLLLTALAASLRPMWEPQDRRVISMPLMAARDLRALPAPRLLDRPTRCLTMLSAPRAVPARPARPTHLLPAATLDLAPRFPREPPLPPLELVPRERLRATLLPSGPALLTPPTAAGAVVTVFGASLAWVLKLAFGVKVTRFIICGGVERRL